MPAGFGIIEISYQKQNLYHFLSTSHIMTKEQNWALNLNSFWGNSSERLRYANRSILIPAEETWVSYDAVSHIKASVRSNFFPNAWFDTIVRCSQPIRSERHFDAHWSAEAALAPDWSRAAAASAASAAKFLRVRTIRPKTIRPRTVRPGNSAVDNSAVYKFGRGQFGHFLNYIKT